MTVRGISSLSWTIFAMMSLAFWPLASAITGSHAVPAAVRVALTAVVAAGLWWAPFGYAVYLRATALRDGDQRLLRRGVRGTALVLSVKRTSEVVSRREFSWHAPWVFEYALRVSLPGRDPYDTTCRLGARDLAPGAVVCVAASKRNRKRIAIDPGAVRALAVAPGTAVLAGV